MPETTQGQLVSKGLRFALVVSRYNEVAAARLIDGALDGLTRHGVADKEIRIVRVPGSFEIPLVARRLAASKRYAAIICLGVLVRGDTPHFDVLAAEVCKGAAQASLETGVPVVFGVLTCDTLEQAIDRSGGKSGNRGFEAATAAIEMANLMPQLG